MKAPTAVLIAGAGICITLIALLAGAPIIQAKGAYDRASAIYDREGQCDNATRLTEAWAVFGPVGFSSWWSKQAEEDCAQARKNRLERGL